MRTLLFGLSEGLSSLRRRWGTALIFSFGLGTNLALLSLFGLTASYIGTLLSGARGQLEFVVFLGDGIGAEQAKILGSRIAEKEPRLTVAYVSKEEALSQFQGEVDVGEYLRILGYNPLPPTLRVGTRDPQIDPSVLRDVIPFIRTLPGVEKVSEGAEAVHRVLALFRAGLAGGWILGLGLGCSLLIMLLQGLDRIFAERRREQSFLKTVGGVRVSMLRAPYVLEGLLLGLCGGALGAGLVGLGLAQAAQALPGIIPDTWQIFVPVEAARLPSVLAEACLAAGGLLGLGAGSWYAARHV